VSDLRKLIVEAASRQPPPVEEVAGDDISVEPDFELDLVEHRQQYEIQSLWQQHRESIETHDNRISYIGRIFWLVVGWLACVVLCIVLTGYEDTGFKLSDQVLIAFITSTTINVVGLFVIVAKWLYPSPASKTTAPKASSARPKAKKSQRD